MADDTGQAKGTTGFLLEMGMLKRAKRSSWWIAGVKDPGRSPNTASVSHSSARFSP